MGFSQTGRIRFERMMQESNSWALPLGERPIFYLLVFPSSHQFVSFTNNSLYANFSPSERILLRNVCKSSWTANSVSVGIRTPGRFPVRNFQDFHLRPLGHADLFVGCMLLRYTPVIPSYTHNMRVSSGPTPEAFLWRISSPPMTRQRHFSHCHSQDVIFGNWDDGTRSRIMGATHCFIQLSYVPY